MKFKRFILYTVIFVFIFSIGFQGCHKNKDTVTVYTSVDRNYSEQVFKDFENKTGITVLARYDTEASKTTGMVNRLIEEKSNPLADVFWNGEFAQTILLKEKGVLDAYASDEAREIPSKYKDDEGYWTAFGGRARCFIVNTDLLSEPEYPLSIIDFISDKYNTDKIGMAYPIFGTTATHAAALFAFMGDAGAEMIYQDIYDKGVRIVDGNGAVRDLVADGDLVFGITDTDDAIGAIKAGKPVAIVFPDQESGGIGTLITPNTAALVKGAPNVKNAKIFLDYMVSKDTEKYLVDIGWSQVSVRDVGADMPYFNAGNIKTMNVSLNDVYKKIEYVKSTLKEMYVR